MTKLKALLYPATFPRANICPSLSQIFDSLVVLLPTEKSEVSSDFIEIESLIPAPLEDQSRWFDDVLKNWKYWASNMGLGREISADSILNALSSEEETVNEIMKSLKGGEKYDALMEARLFLQLAHEADMAEDEIDREYSSILSHERKIKTIFSGMGNESVKDYKPDYPVASLSRPRERLKAWLHLFKMKDFEALPVGHGIGVKDLLDKAYEKMEPGKTALDVLRIRLSLNFEIRPVEDMEFRKSLFHLVDALKNGNIEDTKEISYKISTLLTKSRFNDFMEGPELCLTLYPGRSINSVMAFASRNEKPGKEERSSGWSFFLC